jgi:hypothetical protein
MNRIISHSFLLLALVTGAGAATYYVHPDGDDNNNGLSPDAAWAMLDKVNNTSFQPGDSILLARSQEWRGQLWAGSDGAPGSPIVYDAYGEGDRPVIWGSEVLNNGDFQHMSGSTYRIPFAQQANSVLIDHVFLVGPTPHSNISSSGDVQNTDSSWFWESGMLYVNTGGGDPRSDGKEYTVCVREDLVSTNYKSHLVFRNLVVRESAVWNMGYGFRSQNSEDILWENCAAFHCAKHHFGVINTTGFVGRNLYGAWAMPAQGWGGATTYVPYSDHTRSGDSSLWIDCTAEHMWDTYFDAAAYPSFYTHGEGIGKVVIRNFTSLGCGFHIGAGEAENVVNEVYGGLVEDGDMTVGGKNTLVDGITIKGANAWMTLWGDNLTVQNSLIIGNAQGRAAVIDQGGRDHTLRFNTIVPSAGGCLVIQNENPAELSFYGNIMLSNGVATFNRWNTSLQNTDIVRADYNFYGQNASFNDGNGELSLSAWQSMGFDANSLSGDPEFTDAASNDYSLGENSPAIDAALTDPELVPETDINRVSRPADAADMGAFEYYAPVRIISGKNKLTAAGNPARFLSLWSGFDVLGRRIENRKGNR